MPDHEVDLVSRTRFAELIRWWSDDTETTSSTTRIVDHPAAREIVAIGAAAVPFLLEELARHLTIQCLIALKRITGTNPFPPKARGDIFRMAEA